MAAGSALGSHATVTLCAHTVSAEPTTTATNTKINHRRLGTSCIVHPMGTRAHTTTDCAHTTGTGPKTGERDQLWSCGQTERRPGLRGLQAVFRNGTRQMRPEFSCS